MSGGKGGGCMGPVGLVMALGLVVWLLVEPESFQAVFVQMAETFIDLVRTAAEMIERESADPAGGPR